MQIGPAKKHVQNHIDSAVGLLQEDIPTDDTELTEYLENLQVQFERLAQTTGKLRGKHDKWVTILTELQDEVELEHYEASC